VLAPGLRLGYVVAPEALYPKLLQAKQAVDLHTSGFTQRVVMSLLSSGFDMAGHLQTVRARYRAQRDAMAAALARHMPAGCSWTQPSGGMFFWLQAPDGVDATALLPEAVRQGVAYVPGAAFYASPEQAALHVNKGANSLRLSFVTLGCEAIEESVVRLARAFENARVPA
jgi:2-aminoadipate transaminase